MSNERDDDYLWEGSEADEAELRELEAKLAPLRPVRAPEPPPRRRWLAPLISALLLFAAVVATLPGHAVPSRVAGLFHDNFMGDIGVRGGTRIELRIAGEAPDEAMTVAVAEVLAKRGANVVFTRPGAVIVDLIDTTPGEVEPFVRGLGVQGRLQVSLVVHDDAEWQLLGDPAEDAAAAALGVRADIDAWTHDRTGTTIEDLHLVGPSRAALAEYLAGLGAPPGTAHVVEELAAGSARSYLVNTTPVLTEADVVAAVSFHNVRTERPEVLIELSEAGARRFAEATAAHTGARLAILVDGVVLSAPVVDSAITGGRVSITFSEEDLADSRLMADGLARALRTGPLPAPVDIEAMTRIAPVLSDVELLAARGLFALPFAVLAFGLGLIAVRLGRRRGLHVVPLRGAERARGRFARRVLATGGGIALATLACALAASVSPATSPLPRALVVSLSLLPIWLAFLLVELATLAVPRWRALRDAAPRERRALGWATAGLAVLLVPACAWLGFELNLIAGLSTARGLLTSLATPALAAAAAALVSRHGVGNGFAVVLATLVGLVLFDLAGAVTTAHTLGSAALLAIAAVTLTAAVLGRRVGGPIDAVALPTCGIVPMMWPALIAPLGLSWVPGLHAGASLLQPALYLIATAVLAVALSVLFSSPRRRSAVRILGVDHPAEKRFWISTALSTGFVLALAGLYLLDGRLPLQGSIVLSSAAGAALALDLGVEIRAAWRNPTLVPVRSIRHMPLADLATHALVQRGIDVHARGRHLRLLFQVLAPFCPVTLMVPEDKADEARQVLASLLAP